MDFHQVATRVIRMSTQKDALGVHMKGFTRVVLEETGGAEEAHIGMGDVEGRQLEGAEQSHGTPEDGFHTSNMEPMGDPLCAKVWGWWVVGEVLPGSP